LSDNTIAKETRAHQSHWSSIRELAVRSRLVWLNAVPATLAPAVGRFSKSYWITTFNSNNTKHSERRSWRADFSTSLSLCLGQSFNAQPTPTAWQVSPTGLHKNDRQCLLILRHGGLHKLDHPTSKQRLIESHRASVDRPTDRKTPYE